MDMATAVLENAAISRSFVSTVQEREKARARPIDYPYVEFATEVRRLLGYEGDRPFLTARGAEIKSGVNHSTIAGMIRGKRGSRETIIQFAERLGGDPDLLLRLADYLLETETVEVEEEDIPDAEHEIVGSYDDEDFYIAARENGVTDEQIRKIREKAAELRREKARRQGRE
jgi:plasmid maintenance system antidote protein VapI